MLRGIHVAGLLDALETGPLARSDILPPSRGWRLEVGGWRGWRLEAGGWRLEAGGWRLEAGELKIGAILQARAGLNLSDNHKQDVCV